MLNEEKSMEYWKNHSAKLGERAVGFGDKDMNQQDAIYKIVKEFIFRYVDFRLDTLDYGCGIGRHTPNFTGKYLGIDMTENMIYMANKRNPGRHYIWNNSPYLNDENIDFTWIEQFFTATVLQHCDDDLVKKILESLHYQKRKGFTFALYENSAGFKKPHVIGRNPNEYVKFMEEVGFHVKDILITTHLSKGEPHSLIKVRV